MTSPERDERLWGALYGAVIGTELGAAYGGPVAGAPSISEEPLPWREPPQPTPPRTWIIPLTPVMASVVRAYQRRPGQRIMPEDWAEELKTERALPTAGAFWLMDFYSAIELLREGMSPRLTGLHTTPSGCIVAIAPIVGAFHAGDSDMAYVEAMELASVVQRRPATDWAALLAAAIAAALSLQATPESVIMATLAVAHRRAPGEAAALEEKLRQAQLWGEDFPRRLQEAVARKEWHAADPLGWALTLLQRLGEQPIAMMNLALQWPEAYVYALGVGALVGALNGALVWPSEWRERSGIEALAPMLSLIEQRRQAQQVVVRELETLVQAPAPGSEEGLLVEKIYGCLLGGAIGNAMGSPAEGLFYTEVLERFGGPITTILQPERLEGEDDNQMAWLLVRTYLRQGGEVVTARDVGQTWLAEMRREGFWLCCRNALDQLRAGLDPRIAGHWNWVTGSTVMCMEPVGLYHATDPWNAYVEATAISYLEQRGLDVTAAAILAASVAEAMRAEASVDSVLQAALAAAPRTKMLTFDEAQPDNPHDYIALCLEVAERYDDVLAAFPELYARCLRWHHIDPLELLGLAYAIVKIARGDTRQAAIGGATIGRDADTICGRATMLCATLNGAASLPPEWVALVPATMQQRLRDAARDFAALLREVKLPRLKANVG